MILIPIQLWYPNVATEFWLTFYYRVLDHMYLQDVSQFYREKSSVDLEKMREIQKEIEKRKKEEEKK